MTLSRLGLALTLAELPAHARWLLDGERDIELQDMCDPAVLEGDWRGVAARSKALLAGHRGRLGIHGPFWDLPLAPQDPAVRAVVRSRLLQGLAAAELLEASHMVVHSPFVFFGHPLVAHRASLAAETALVQDTLAPVLQRAGEIGCTLVVENILDLNPAPWLALARSFASPHLCLSVDVGHAQLMQARGGPPAAQWLREAGELLGHVHLHDNDGSLDQHLAPGEGRQDWPGVLRALAGAPETARLIVEVVPSELARGVAWIEGVTGAGRQP